MQMPRELLRIMIVDDEDVFRAHLRAMLHWQSYGFCICAEASSGQEAMELLESQDPDIVITDIQMPEVDGLTLISHMAEHYPHIQTIALSGYDEYKYVRAGMKKGVLDYLLKHQITPDGLYEAIEAARQRIDNRRREMDADRLRAQQAEMGQMTLRKNFLQDLLAGNIGSRDDFAERAAAVGLAVDGGYSVLLAAEIDQMSRYKEQYDSAEWLLIFDNVIRMVERVVDDAGDDEGSCGLVMSQPESRFVLYFSMPGSFSLLRFYNHIHACLQNIRSALKKHYNMTACYSISAHISDHLSIPTWYRRVLGNLENKIYHGQDMVLQAEGVPLENTQQEEASFGVEDEKEIRTLLREGDLAALQERVDALFERYRSSHMEPGRIFVLFAEMLSILNRVARQEHMDLHELMPMSYVYDRARYMTLDEMKQFFLEGCRALLKHRAPHAQGSGREVTQKALAYIQRNYAQPVSLADIAADGDISAAYLSRVFKEDTGKTVVEYLNEVRIQAAKQLIDEGVRPKDLAAQLGFNSASYFTTVFRQKTGKTPMQYKKRRKA